METSCKVYTIDGALSFANPCPAFVSKLFLGANSGEEKEVARPRSTHNDCVVAVFRELTGEDKATAENRFLRHLDGAPGISLDALRSCLADVGRTLTPWPITTLAALGKGFQGEAVVFYAKDGDPVHAILVRSGGVVFDPATDAPEDGEFIVDYLERIGGSVVSIRSVLMVA